MLQRVYIETTFVSYLTARSSRDVVIAGHQQSTQDWWEQSRVDFELCTSQLVLLEAGAGDQKAAQERLVLLKAMIMLDTTEEAVILASELVRSSRFSTVGGGFEGQKLQKSNVFEGLSSRRTQNVVPRLHRF